MSYQKKYFYTFVNKLSTTITVEIWEDSEATITATRIYADLNPAILKYANKLEDSVWASGAELEVLSETDRQFIGLYTNDMLKYQVRIYRAGEYLAWCGYLDTENYEESFSDTHNYPVRFTANDGFALLSRIKFTYFNGNSYVKYEGIDSMWLILMRVLYKIKLPWDFIYVGVSASIPEVELDTDETIFEHLYLNTANYYNEDDEPESCRTVLEEMLKPFCAFIIQTGGSLIITDAHYISAGTTKSFKKYSFGNTYLEYVEDVDLTVNNGDITSLGVEDSTSSFSLEAGINKQIVSYSPYNQNEAFNFDASKHLYGPGESTEYGATDYKWVETLYANSKTLNAHNNAQFAKLKGIDGANTSVEEEYSKMKNPGLTGREYYMFKNALESEKHFTAKIPLPSIVPTDNYKLKLEARAFLRTTDNLNGPPPFSVKKFTLYFRLKIGDKKLSLDYSESKNTWYIRWVDLASEYDAIMLFLDRPFPLSIVHDIWNPVNDKWLEFKKRKYYFYGENVQAQVVDMPFLVDIPDTKINGGEMELTIYNYSAFVEAGPLSLPEVEASDFRISNFRVSITDSNGNELDTEDIEYVSNIDDKYMNEGKEIRVLHGTNIDQHPIQRGNILVKFGEVYQCLSSINFAGIDTDLPENVILKSIQSNYTDASAVLECTLPQVLNIGYVTYNNYLPEKNMLILDNTIDLKEMTSKVKLRECNQYIAE